METGPSWCKNLGLTKSGPATLVGLTLRMAALTSSVGKP